MIVLLSYSSSWSENNAHHSFTGEVPHDSVLVSVDDLRAANAKMIELRYENEINNGLKEIIKNDSVAIVALREDNSAITEQAKKYKRQRNVAGGTGICVLLLLILSLL